MFKVFFCIQNQHDLRLVLLAGLICVAASVATVVLLRQAREQKGSALLRWIAGAGLASGFGIWATHFIAMIGYDPGVFVGYEAGATFLSLLVAVIATSLGFRIAVHSNRLGGRCLAGAVIGGGVAAMHYCGMLAVQLPGHFAWDPAYVAASILFAILSTIPALTLALDRRSPGSTVGAALLIVAAILLLHFTGMGGITLIPDGVVDAPVLLLSPLAMGITVATTAFALLAVGVIVAVVSGRARARIAAKEREFRILVQGISDCALYMLSENGRVASWNAGAQRLVGYGEDEAIGLDVAAFHSPADRAAELLAQSLAVARSAGKFTGEGWRYRKNGTRFWAHVTIESVFDEHGVFHGFAKITRDMTRFKEDQDRLQALTDNLDTALSSMHQGLCLYGPDDRLIMSNRRFREIFDLTPEEAAPGTHLVDITRCALEKRAGGPVDDAVLEDALERHRSHIRRPEGGSLTVTFTPNCILSVAHHRTRDGGWVSTTEDVTEQRRAEQRIAHMALHDGLTGLPNRVSYNERLDAAIADAAEIGTRVAVIGIDLDRFKEVNDTHGHAVGDAVLKTLAERMREGAEPSECVARFGGDEFAAFKCFEDRADLDAFVARLEGCLATPIEVGRIALQPGASLGVAVYPADGETREQVVNNADLAMYRAKSALGRRLCFYEQGMDEAARARRVLANDLREAIARDELSMVYQVQRSVRTGEITGYEALLRWRHPRDGWVSPVEFIPIAEESGEIIALGEWALRTACADAMRWPEPWRVAVNLSPVQLMDVGLIEIVTNALLTSGLPANRLELEITETAFVTDKVRAMHVLRRLKAIGIAIAIDDFGTGYSSLDTLNSFPFDKIKIDKSFLIGSDQSHQSRSIIRAILALGQSLDIPVLAEGLENAEQLNLLKNEGCDEAQGYHWGRPVQHQMVASRHHPPVADAA